MWKKSLEKKYKNENCYAKKKRWKIYLYTIINKYTIKTQTK